MPMRVLIDMPVQKTLLRKLQDLKEVTVDVLPETEVTPVPRPAEVPADLAPEIDAMFCTYPPVNLHEMRKLRFVQISSAGYSQLFGLNLPGRGMREQCSWVLRCAHCRVECGDDREPRARCSTDDPQPGFSGMGSRASIPVGGTRIGCGLWGYGGIGRETARLLRAMDCVSTFYLAAVSVRSRTCTRFQVPATPTAFFRIRYSWQERNSRFLAD